MKPCLLPVFDLKMLMLIIREDNTMRRFFELSLAVLMLCALTSCSPSAEIGSNGMRAKTGKWLGQNDTGQIILEFSIVSREGGGSEAVLMTYGYPCGKGPLSITLYNFPDLDNPRPISKAAIHDGGFEMKVDHTLTTPGGLILTGQFIDGTHLDGTWEVFDHQVLDDVCPAAHGNWQGRPK